MALRIEQTTLHGFTVFALIGRMEAEQIAELEELLGSDRHRGDAVLDLGEIRFADREAIRFLARCEADGVQLKNCPSYIREWMKREKG